jgi:protein SDA1
MGKNRSRSDASKAKGPGPVKGVVRTPNTQFTKRGKTWEKKKTPNIEASSKAADKAVTLNNVNKFEHDLNLFLSKIHQTPFHYKEEMVIKIAEFNDAFTDFKENSQKRDEKFARLTVFLANVIEYYQKDLAFLVPTVCDALSSYANVMHPFVRMKCVQCLTIITKKGLWDPIESLTFIIKLFIVKDKELRTFLGNHIIASIKKLVEKNKDNTVKTKLQKLFNELLVDANEKVAKRAFLIMTELYKKQIWRDKKLGNAISTCVFNDSGRVSLIACMYMLENTVEFEKNYEESSEEDDMENAYDAKEKGKHAKMSKRKEKKLDDDLKKAKRRQKRRGKVAISQNSFLIDDIYNAQEFSDKLFVRLAKGKEKFNHKLAMMGLLSRMIGRHKLIQPNFYSFLQRYLKPGQKECPKVLMYLAEACHQQVPQESILPVLKYIIMNFANESCKEDRITGGLNSITQMCQRMPLLMESEDLNFLANLRYFKNKGVSTAARALINLYRDLNPMLLTKEFRGREKFDEAEDRLYLGKKNY